MDRGSFLCGKVRIVNCFGCLYVWMYGPGALKRSVFTRGFPVRVLPHTRDQKTSPNGLQEYVFMEVLAGSRFEVFEVHPSIRAYARYLLWIYISIIKSPNICDICWVQHRFYSIFTREIPIPMERLGVKKL